MLTGIVENDPAGIGIPVFDHDFSTAFAFEACVSVLESEQQQRGHDRSGDANPSCFFRTEWFCG
jgi:hypothetical protein